MYVPVDSSFRYCPGCQQATSHEVLSLASVPVFCNVLHQTREAARTAARGALQLRVCDSCGLIYNASFEPALVDYQNDYENALHFSPVFADFLGQLSRRLVAGNHLQRARILEIGCGDGYFLKMLCKDGCNIGLGFDPSAQAKTLNNGTKMAIFAEPYTADNARDDVDFVCCRHVLEHLDRPRELISLLMQSLKRSRIGRIYCEVPNVRYMLDKTSVWDALYEHCLYFSPESLASFFRRIGCEVVAEETAFGEQFAAVTASVHGRNAKIVHDHDVRRLVNLARDFERNAKAKLATWEAKLHELQSQGRRIALWGSGTKGVMFLNTVANSQAVDFVVDLNPRKHGCFVAGTGHAICSPDALRDGNVTDIVLTNPLYQSEIRSHVESLGITAQLHCP